MSIFPSKSVDIKIIKNIDIDNLNLHEYNAEILSYNIPSRMVMGETYLASITVKNLGDNSWTILDKYFLGEVDNKFDFRPYRIYLPRSVRKGEIVEFKFQMKAPEKEGLYNQKFRMVREFVAWFGDTLDTNIEVTKDERYKPTYKIEKSLSDSVDYSAEIIDFSIPKRMVAGKTYPVYLSIKNNGGFLWNKANNVFLGFSEDKTQFSSSIRIDSYETRKNEIMNFKFQMTAPASKGLYIQKFQMVRELVAWFGDTISFPIEVVDSIGDENFNIIKDLIVDMDYASEIVGFDFPREVIAGKVYLVSLFIKNTGTKAWISGDDYYLGSVDNKSNFGIDRIPMPKIVYPGEIVCLKFSLVAPPEEGLYVEKLRMVQELVAWFGDIFEIQINVKKNSEILSAKIDKFTLLLSSNDLKYFEDFSNASIEQATKAVDLNNWRKAKLIFGNHAYDVKVKIHGDSMNHYDTKTRSYRIKLAENEFINGSGEFSLIIFSDRSYIPILFDNFLKKFNIYFLEQKLVFFSLNGKKYLPYYFRPAKNTDFVEKNEFSNSYFITKPIVDHLFSVFISAEGHQSFLDYSLSHNEIKPAENVEKVNYSLYLLRRLFLDKSKRLFDYFDREYLLNFEAITTLFLNTHDVVGDNLAMIYRATNGKFVPMPSEEFMFIYRNLLVEVESNHVYCDRLSGYRLADFVKIFSYFNSDPGFRQEKYKKVFDTVKDDTYFNKAVVDFENSILAMMHEGIDYRQFGNSVYLLYLKHNMEFLKNELSSSKFLIFPKAIGSSRSVIKLNPISISEMKFNNFKIKFK
ncbi:MAG: NBR1-Ig-like domain-containing protein, partial [Candidatus Gracilibacteria bacterium]